MTDQPCSRDLLVLVADADMREVMRGVLGRSDEVAAGQLDFDVQVHPQRDGGCRTGAATYLRPYLKRFRYCMVVFDRYGCGSRDSREDIQRSVESDLARNGWDGRSKVIVIEPELEAWIWGDLKAASRQVGWPGDHTALRERLAAEGHWPRDQDKPEDPKRAMREAMSRSPLRRQPRRSARVFRKIADSARFDGCRDAAFNELRETLMTWFSG